MLQILAVGRYVVFVAFALAFVIAVASWLVRSRRVSPFSPLGRSLRAVSDLVMAPLEARLARAGGNPVHAGWWLVIGVALGGLVLLWLLEWLLGTAWSFTSAMRGGPRALAFFAVDLVYWVLVTAILVRVIAGWLGFFRYSWVRPAYWLTDWLVNPIRRVLPPFGMLDLSPLAAWLVLMLIRRFVVVVLMA